MTGFRIDDLALEVLKRAVHKTVQHALYFYRILFLNLSIISICSVFSVVMLILKFLWCRSYLQIYQFAAAMPSLPLLPEQLHYEQLHVHLFPM